MANKGDLVFYNDDPTGTADNWVPAQVVMTDTDPTPDQWAASYAANGGAFPPAPPAGQVLLTYYAQSGNQIPNNPTAMYAAEGTASGQYQATNPNA